MFIFVATLGVILSQVHQVPPNEFIPFFSVSLLFWTFLSNSINETMDSPSQGAELIKDRAINPRVPVFQSIFRNIIVALHCLPVPLATMFWFNSFSFYGLITAVPGLILFVMTVFFLSYSVSGVGARYRDLKRIIESTLMLAFIATPIMWQPDILRRSGSLALALNPLAHMFDSWREPLLNSTIRTESLIVSFCVMVCALFLAILSNRLLKRAVLWI